MRNRPDELVAPPLSRAFGHDLRTGERLTRTGRDDNPRDHLLRRRSFCSDRGRGHQRKAAC